MTSQVASKSFLESFNLDGMPSSNPLEKIKKERQSIDEKKKTLKKFLIWGLASHLIHFIMFYQAPTPPPSIQTEQIIPNNFGQVSLPAVLATELKKEVTRVKILDRSYRRKIAEGYIKRSENISSKSQFMEHGQKKTNFYIPYTKFEDILIASTKGIVIVPHKMKNKKRSSHEITFQ